jgi:lipopolysaccharide/colanic/teichoic acid biosynthesis glycosyltransferase
VREFGVLVFPGLGSTDFQSLFRNSYPEFRPISASFLQQAPDNKVGPGCSRLVDTLGGIVVKRSFDIAFSAAFLLCALPVLTLAALLIRLTSPGPVLFRQTRIGRGFHPFEILKLRTMAHAEGGLAFTFGPDPRITSVGKFLRRSKLDELPQLWNVLRGQMSVVGPRPVVPELTHEFRDEYAFLLRARPGLTDPASLKYSQEARLLARSSDAMQFFKTVVTPDKLRVSFEYMQQANLWTDLETIAMTAVICAFPSMSRIYGELPEVKDIRVTEIWQSQRPEKRATPQVDGSVFAHNLAQIEASMEESPSAEVLPWIPRPNSDLVPQSAPPRFEQRANRL